MASNDRYINIGMGLDIEDLRTGLSEAKREMALAESEFKAQTAGLDKWSDSIEGVEAKLTQMATEMAAKQRIVEAYRGELQRVTDAYGENSAKADEIRTKLNNAEAAYTKAEKYTEDLKDRLEELKREQGSASSGADTLKDKLRDMGTSASEAVKGGLSKLKEHLTDLARNAVAKLVEGLKEFAKQVIEAGKQYTSTMSEVRAISGAGVEEFKKLQDAAREAGETTIYSANEAAEALKYMALAGWSADESASALGGVLDLAAASGMDLAKASDVVTDYITAFGLEAQDAARFADALAYAQGNSNTSVTQLAEAYKGCAAVMSADGQTFETTTALLAKMADAGTKGSSAGTGLAAVMRDLTKKMEDGSIAIGETRVRVQDADGNFRSLTSILRDVQRATDGMGSAEKAAALQTTFTSEAVKALALILNQGADSVAEFEDELRGSNGTAKQMSDIMNDNLSGDLKRMEARMTELKLRLFELIEGPLRGLVQIVTDIVPKVIEFGESVYNFFVGIYNATKPLWDALGAFFGEIWAKIEKFVEDVKVIVDAAKRAWDGVKNVFSGADGWFRDLSSKMQTMLKAGWDTIAGWFGNVWSGIKNAFSGASSWFSGLSSDMKTMLEAGWDTIGSFFSGVWSDISGAFSGASSWFSSAFSGVWEAIKRPFDNVAGFFRGIYNSIIKIFKPVLSFFGIETGSTEDALAPYRQAVEEAQAKLTRAKAEEDSAYADYQHSATRSMYNRLMGTFEETRKAKSDLVSAQNALAAAQEGAEKDTLGGMVGGLGDTIKDGLTKGLQGVTDIILKPFQEAWDAITGLFRDVAGWFQRNILDPLTKGVEDAIGEASNLGGGMVQGVVQGKQDVVSGSTTIGEIITNSLMDYFGIHSPSTLMRDLIGKNITAGIAEGMTDATGLASGAAEMLASDLTGAFGLSAGASGGRVGQTVVFNQTINSPSPMTAGEIYRDTRSLIGRRMTS